MKELIVFYHTRETGVLIISCSKTFRGRDMAIISFVFGILVICFLAGMIVMPIVNFIAAIFVKNDKAFKAVYIVAWGLILSAAIMFGVHERNRNVASETEEAAKASVVTLVADKSSNSSLIGSSSFNSSDEYEKEHSSKDTPAYKDGLESDGKIHVYLVGNGETIKAKKSSSIRSMTYYEESDHLIINFNGKEYVFANVGSSLWKSFKDASSSDAFYDSHIKGEKSYWINDYNGKNGGLIVMENVKSNNLSSRPSTSYSSGKSSDTITSKHSYVPDYATCAVCDRPYSTDEMWDVSGEYICENCLEGGDFATCESCGEVYHVDDMYYVDGYVCESCMEELAEEYGDW